MIFEGLFPPLMFAASLLTDEPLRWRIFMQPWSAVVPFWASNDSGGRQVIEALALVGTQLIPPCLPVGTGLAAVDSAHYSLCYGERG